MKTHLSFDLPKTKSKLLGYVNQQLHWHDVPLNHQTRISTNKTLLLGLVIFFLTGSQLNVFSQVNAFVGGGDGFSWNDPANWNLGVPTASHDIEFDFNISPSLVINTNAECKSLTLKDGNYGFLITFSSTSQSLTITEALTLVGSTGTFSSYDRVINVNGASLTCGSLVMVNSNSSSRTCEVNLTSGSLTVTGNITMGLADRHEIDLGNDATLNLGGSITGGNLIRGNNSTVNFNGTSAQVLPTAYQYHNITINNPAGVTLDGNLQHVVMGGNISGNLNVASGILNNGGYAIHLSNAHAFTVVNGATFNLSGTSSMVTGAGTLSFGSNSNINYTGSNQTVFAGSYGNLGLSGSGTKSFAGNTTIVGSLNIASGIMASLPNGSTSSANTLTMGGLGRPAGSHGSSASAATFQSDVFFDGATDGILNVATNTCAPFSATISGDNLICVGGSSNLVVTITGGNSPYTVDYTGGTVNNYTSGDNIPVSPAITTVYSLITVTDNIGCTATLSGSATVTVQPLPTIDAGPNQTVCASVTTVTMAGYSFTNASGADWSGGAGSWAGDVYTPTSGEKMSGSVVLTYTTNTAAPCMDIADDVTINFTQLPTADAGPTSAAICADGTYSTAATATNGTILWTSSASGSFDDDTAEDPVYTPNTSGLHTLTMTVTGLGVCISETASDNVALTVNSLPMPVISGNLNLNCANPTTMLSTTLSYSAYSWSTGSTNPTITTGAATGITVMVTDGNGCQATSAPVNTVFYPVTNSSNNTDYLTIQAAINAASPGHTIEICDGTYNERLTVNKSLTLQGQSETGTMLSGTGLAGVGSGITINSGITNVTIENLTIKNFAGSGPNSYAGIYAVGGNNNLTVQNSTIKDNVGGSGFYANGPVTDVLLNNLDVSGHTNVAGAARGIVIWNGLKSNITITNCDVYNNNCCGIELQDGSGTGVTIANNNVYDNGDNGIGLVGLSGPGANTVNNNTLTNNGRFGIEIKNPDGNGAPSGAGSVVVSNNNISRNVAIVDLRDIAGIAVMRRGVSGTNPDVPKGVYVSGNTVSGYTQSSSSEGFGIVLGGIDHTVTGNTVSGNEVGIQQQAGHLPYPGDGDQSNLADQYFGRDNSPYTCANVISANTFSSNGIDSRNVGPIGGDGFVTNSNTGRTFCSIQSAIDHATTLAGHTLIISAGTFEENVVVNKSLTLEGANANTPCGSRVAETLITTSSGTPMTITANNVTVNGFEITAVSSAYGIVCGNTSGLSVIYNNIHDIGNSIAGTTVFGINYTLGSASHNTITISDNCLTNIAASTLTNFSAGAIIVAQSTATGVLTNVDIERNIINGVTVNNGPWPTGKIAYGIQVNVGGSGSYLTTTGKVQDLTLANNEIINISGHIATGIGLEGNTENAMVNNNLVSNLTGTKNSGSRAGGGFDLSGIKFENNRYTHTVTVENNSFATNTFVHAAGMGIGYAVSNYVPVANSGILTLDCNWFGTAVYNQIDDNPTFTGKIFNKDNCTTNFTPYLVSGGDGPGIGFQPTALCNGTPVTISIASNTPQKCFSGPGALTTTTGGGVMPYNYLWSNGSVTANISGLSAGNYTVTVTDDLGSTATATAIVLYYPIENEQTGNGYTSIQAAINDAATLNGHTIHVCSGTYNENVTVSKEITITGAGTTNTILTPSTACSGTGILISANNVTIQDLKVTNYTNGLAISSSNVMVENVESIGNCNTGMDLQNGTTNLVVNNSKLNNNVSTGFRKGTAAVVSGFTFSNSEAKGNVQGCFIAKNNGAGGTFDNVTITDSDFSNNTQKGMYFEALSNAMLDGIVMQNSGTDAAYGFNNGIDINLKYASYSNITIQNSEFTNCGHTGTATDQQNPSVLAVKARDDAPSYNGNPASLSNVLIKNNVISGPRNALRIGEFGKINSGPTNVTIEGNDLAGPFGHKTIINRTNSDVNMVCNWHGTTDNLAIFATLVEAGTGDILMNTVLGNGTDGNMDTGFQPSASCICPSGNIVTNVNTTEVFCSIQAAIDDADTNPGDVIEVGSGTYIEDVIVHKSLDIRGPKYGIAGNGGGRGTGEAVVVPATSQVDAIFMIRANDVSINGFTINGDNTSLTTGWTATNGADIDAFDGVGMYDPNNVISVSGAKIENNIIENLAYFGVDNFGWYNYNNPATSGHLVKNNLFRNLGTYGTGSGYDFWGGGVLIYNNNYTRIENNEMTNVRIGVQTGNFSKVNPGSADYQVITNNTMQVRRRGIFHNLAYSNAAVYTLSDNTITGLTNANETVWDGILLSSLSVPSTTTNNSINGTGISNPSEGIEVWNVKNTSPASISGGSISNVNTGIFLNNYEGYNSNASDGPHATVTGPLMITPNATGTGVRLLDSPSSTTHAKVNASVSSVTISGGAEGIKLEQTNVAGAAVGGSFVNNTISASVVGVNVARSTLSATNTLTIDDNDIDLTAQVTGGNPTVGILLSDITGSDDVVITDNDVTDAFYGYVGYNINTTPITTINGGTISGVMQGIAFVNTVGGPLAGSTTGVSGVTMNGFAGTSANPANNFHAGVYTFTAGGTTAPTGINLTIDNVTIDGTGAPSQSSGGVYLADFSGGGTNVQTVSLTNSSIINNANRGVDARGKVNLTMTGNTLTNNGHIAFGAGGNNGFSVIAQQNATITANNNFITLPATSSTEVFGLITGNGSTNLITAEENSILLNGNADPDSRLAQSLSGTGSINAECNWWGTANYQTIQSLTNGNVDFINWLINGTDDDGMTAGFQPVAGSCTGTPMVVNVDAITPATCYTGNNGALDISVTGGTPAYSYNWSNGDTSQDAIMLTPGSYTVTVTDSFGSTATASASVGLLPVENVNTQTGYSTITAAVSAASPGDVIEVCAGTYTESLSINKNLTINGPNEGTPGNGTRVAEAILQDGSFVVAGANTVILDGFHIYQTNTTTPVSLGGGAVATIRNNKIERFGVTAGSGVRGVEISAGSGAKIIEGNLFSGDISGGVFSGHKTWNSGMYVNGAGSTISILNNVFQITRTAINLDDYNSGIIVSGNTFDNNGTHLSFGGAAPTTGNQTLGANNFKAPQSAIINLSNVTTAFRLDMTSSTWDGTSFGSLPNATLFAIEAGMYHRGRSGRNGLVTYKTNNQYVIALNPSIQAANDYAPSGGIVNLDAATFNQKLQITKSLTVQGGTNDKTLHIMNGTGVVGNTRGIEIASGVTNVTIQNLTVQNFAGTDGNLHGGIYAVGPNNHNLTVNNVLIQNNGAGSGFYANGPINNLTITNNMVNNHGNGARGIVVWNGMKTNINISNNMLTNNRCCGIELQDGAASGVNVSYNTIDIGAGDNAIGLTGLDNTVGLNTINNNTITGGGRFGIEIKNPNGGVTVDGNAVTLTSQNTDLRDRAGIVIMRRGVLNPPNIVNANVPDGVTITNNTVNDYRQTNGGSSSTGFGIVVEGTNHVVTNNTLNNNDVAIQLQAGHTPYAAPPVSVDGDQGNLADIYFGRGNSPELCNVVHTPNTFSGNTVNSVRIVTGGGAGTIQIDITPTVDDPADQTLCVDQNTAVVNFTGNYMVGVTYNWVNDNTAIGLAANGSGNIASFTALNTTNAPIVANITVTPTANGCTGSPQTFSITVQPRPSISNQVTSPDGYNQTMVSGSNYAHTICHGEELTTSVPSLTSTLSDACGTLRIQTQYISTLPNIPSATLDETFDNIVLAGAQTISPENHTLINQTVTFLTTPYYDVNGNMMFDAGVDVAGQITQFVLTVQPKPSISNTVTSGVYNQVMTSGGNYAHAICHDTDITTSVPTLNSTLADACGTLRIQTEYISTLPNIPSATLDNTFNDVVAAGPQTISPENNTGMTQTITFITTPYYDVNGNMMYDAGIDISGEVTTFVLTIHPIPTGMISGTAFVIQNAPTTANVIFTGGVGTAPYTFTYNVNGGSTQTISTIGMNNVVTYPHPNGTPGVFTYTLLSVTDANGCEGVVDPMNNTAVITVIDSDELPDLSPSIARPLNASFTNGQSKEGYVQFTNGGNGPTFGVTKVRLPKTVGNFNLVINQSATMSAGQSVQNNNCTFVELLTVWEITYPDPIPIGTNIKIGFTLTATGSTGSNGTMTTTILNGTGGDSNNFNNRATRRFVIN